VLSAKGGNPGRGEMGEESMFPCAFRVWGSWGGGMGELEGHVLSMKGGNGGNGICHVLSMKGGDGENGETRESDYPEILFCGYRIRPNFCWAPPSF